MTSKLMGVRQPFPPAREPVEQSPEVSKLIAGAARAIEVFDEDELEAYTAKQRSAPTEPPASAGITVGIKLPPALHAALKAQGKLKGRALKREALAQLEGAQRARTILRDALLSTRHEGHVMPKQPVRDALEALGIDKDFQP